MFKSGDRVIINGAVSEIICPIEKSTYTYYMVTCSNGFIIKYNPYISQKYIGAQARYVQECEIEKKIK